jgi:hypothetical protein
VRSESSGPAFGPKARNKDETQTISGNASSTLRHLVFAAAIGVAALALLLLTRHLTGGHSDFSVVWRASDIFIHGANPYALIGHGDVYEYELHWPASTLVAVAPLTLLAEHWADAAFVFASSALVAFGAVRENWNRMWIFPSAAFIVAARSAQWSPLMASAYLLPWISFVLVLKPTTGFAVLTSYPGLKPWAWAMVSGLFLGVIALIISPRWPSDWAATTFSSWEYTSPVTRRGGFLLLLSALKWRQREGRFLLFLSLVPQVSSWYEAFLPLLVENQVLSLTSSLGYLLMIPLALSVPNQSVATSTVGSMMVAFCYLPALIVVLRR